MSLHKGVARRLTMLAGSSLVAAGLSAAASIGAAIAPSTAFAQSVCTPAPQTGAGTNEVSYTGSQNSGISCTATGLLTINKVSGAAAGGITATSTGGVILNNTGDINSAANFSGVTGGGVTFVNAGASDSAGRWTSSGASVFSSGNDVVTMLGTITNSITNGSMTFGNGDDTLNQSGTLITNALGGRLQITNSTIDFGAGADTLNVSGRIFVSSGSAINLGADNDAFNLSGDVSLRGVMDFGGGVDAFDNDGRLYLNLANPIVNLEAFNNAGDIVLGGSPTLAGEDGSDGLGNYVFRLSSGTFTGSDGGRILIDANLGVSGSQIGCVTPTIADCVVFDGATTAGTTLLNIRDNSFNVGGGTLGVAITLIEGAAAAEHFILDPATQYYGETSNGPAIRKPVVSYILTYDEANERHVLVGVPGDEMYQVGTFAASAQETWRATAGSWLTRQADLRSTPGGIKSSRGAWARVGAQVGERDAAASYEAQGLSFDYDLAHKQRTAHLVFGADVLGAASQDSAWVLGGMIGYVRSDVDYDAMPTEMVAAGVTGGLYASYVAGPLFVDGVFNVNILDIEANAPAMNLGLDVPMAFTQKSIGGQLEAGWRVALGQSLFVEPLAGVSYVVTQFEDTEVPGGAGVFDFEESRSLRIGGGARIGLDSELIGMAASYSLTARYWNDSEGEGSATVTTAGGTSALLADDFGGGFSEVGASVNLYSEEGGLSGFVNLGGRFADGYQSVDGAVGVRVRW